MIKKIICFIMSIFIVMSGLGTVSNAQNEILLEVESNNVADGILNSKEITQHLTANIEYLGGNKIKLNGATSIIKRQGFNKDNAPKYVVAYRDEKGKEQTAYRKENDTQYYDSKTNKKVNIVFSEDVSSSENDSFIAISTEHYINNDYIFVSDINISFPGKVKYENGKTDLIKIPGKKIYDFSSKEISYTWETKEIYIPDEICTLDGEKHKEEYKEEYNSIFSWLQIFLGSITGSYSDKFNEYNFKNDKYSLPIQIYTTNESVMCKYYTNHKVDNKPSKPSNSNKENYIQMLSGYSENRKYMIGENLQLKVTSCKHDITETTRVRTGEKTVTSDPIVYGTVWEAESGSRYAEETISSVPAGAQTSERENTDKSFDCTNGAYQHFIEKTYTTTTTVPTYSTRTVKVGERSCPIYVTFRGFRVSANGEAIPGGNINSFVGDKSYMVLEGKGGKGIYLTDGEITWSSPLLKIDERSLDPNVMKELQYDKEKGLSYGEIIIKAGCRASVHKRVYFTTLPTDDNVYSISFKARDITDPNNLVSSFIQLPSDKEVFYEEGIKEKYEFRMDNEEYEFVNWTFEYIDKETNKKVKEVTISNESGTFDMPKNNMNIIANLKPASQKYMIRTYVIGCGDVHINGEKIGNFDSRYVKSGEEVFFEANGITTEGTVGDPNEKVDWTFDKYKVGSVEEYIENNVYIHTVTKDEDIFIYFDTPGHYSATYASDPTQAAKKLPETKIYSKFQIDELHNSQLTENSSIKNPDLSIDLNDGFKFNDWNFYTSNKDVSRKELNPKYDDFGTGGFIMPYANVLSLAECKKTDRSGYNLYVTSTEGGTAWTEGNEEYKNVQQITEGLPIGKIMYKIENVKPGQKFKIESKVLNTNYEFGSWEYKPFIVADSEEDGVIEITMPESDLTVTAIFNNNLLVENPTLTVTTNNPEWGDGYLKLEDGTRIEADKYSEVKIGNIYDIEYEAKEGYYFVNWEYSIAENPFIENNKIKMPHKDLVVMAMFAPIPLTGFEGHKITFKARPSEGGQVPEDKDLVDVLEGGKVTMAVTPNRGWEFSHWEFTKTFGNGTLVEVEKYYDLIDGTGYFIMPDYDITATAVFKKSNKDFYKLYITYTDGGKAWTIDNSQEVEIVDKAFVGDIYPLNYKVDDNYKFLHWEFRWDKYDEQLPSDIDPDEFVDKGYAIMPRSDMTVTAVFEEIIPTEKPIVRISTNNPIWGDAWIVVDGEEKHSEWVDIEVGKIYDVFYKPLPGFEFTNWSTEKYFTENFDLIDSENMIFKAKFKLTESKKTEVMAFFKPGEDEGKKFEVTVEIEPEIAGEVEFITGEESYYPGETCIVKATTISEEYVFDYWEYKERNVSNSKKYKFEMPGENVVLIAHFKLKGIDEDDAYKLTVNTNPEGAGTIKVTEDTESITKISEKEYLVKHNAIVEIEVIPDEDFRITENNRIYSYDFDKWYRNDRAYKNEKKIRFEMDQDYDVEAYFQGSLETEGFNFKDAYRIISVRDLRWKDDFVDESGKEIGLYYPIPESGENMLPKKKNKAIKMGYAVEFQLSTIGVPVDNAYIEIIPKIMFNGKVYTKSKGNYREIKDELTGQPIDSKFFEPIIISTSEISDENTKPFMGSEGKDVRDEVIIYNIKHPALTWRWVYYLPAKISINGYGSEDAKNDIKNRGTPKEVTVLFDINVRNTALPRGNDLVYNVVTDAQKNNPDWKGGAFNYSMAESLLDDIYDNSQN